MQQDEDKGLFVNHCKYVFIFDFFIFNIYIIGPSIYS